MEHLASGLGQIIGRLAGGVELQRQGLGLLATRGLNGGQLVELVLAEDLAKLLDAVVEVADASSAAQRGP